MSENQSAQLLLNAQRLRAGVLLTIVGAALGAIGSIVAGVELAAATKKWLAASGQPPSEVAKLKVRQALTASQAASHAAVAAWQHAADGAGDVASIASQEMI